MKPCIKNPAFPHDESAPAPSGHAVYPSEEPCWQCGALFLELRPPLQGWRFDCRRCQHMTSPRAELEAAMAAKPEEAIGIVASWPGALQIEPAGR